MPEVIDQVQETFLPALQAPLEGRLVPSPYNFEFTGEDALMLVVHNSQPGAVVAVHYRMQPQKGPAVAHAYQFTPTSDRARNVTVLEMGSGYLLNLVAFAATGSPRLGQLYVKVEVIRGRGDARVALGTLVQDYVTSIQSVAWPGSPLRSSFENGGYLRHITGTDPAAGTTITETVPTGARWSLICFQAVFTTSAVAGNRTPFIDFRDGVVLLRSYVPTTYPANSVNVFLFWAHGMPMETALFPSRVLAGLPTAPILLAGQTIVVGSEGLDAGDNFAAPEFVVNEWLEAA